MTQDASPDQAGERPVIAFLPGLVCDAALWRAQTEAFSDRYDCRVMDMTRHDSLAGMAAGALEALPERFALVGLSMGGYVAQELMRQAPERVERLALLDTRARADTPADLARRREFLAMQQAGRFPEVVDRLLLLFLHEARLSDSELVESVRAMTYRIGEEAFGRQSVALLSRPETLSLLPTIDCPTLVLCGRQDALTPLEFHEEMAAGIDGAELVVIEDCGHLTTMERPEEVNAALERWLAS